MRDDRIAYDHEENPRIVGRAVPIPVRGKHFNARLACGWIQVEVLRWGTFGNPNEPGSIGFWGLCQVIDHYGDMPTAPPVGSLVELPYHMLKGC